jgi:hypothetical protein
LAEQSELEVLAERRRLLVQRSNQLRQDVGRQLQDFQPAVSWIERGTAVGRSLRSSWPIIGGVATLLFARGGTSWFRKAGKVWSLWRIGKKAVDLWTRFKPR